MAIRVVELVGTAMPDIPVNPPFPTTGVPYVLKLSGKVPPQYTPLPRSVFLQVIGSQSGAKIM